MVGFEHIANSIKGDPVEPYTLRITHIHRRENDEWKIAHRHALVAAMARVLSRVPILQPNRRPQAIAIGQPNVC